MGFHFLLHGIFPTQGSNPGLPHCRQVLYLPAKPQGKPKNTGVGSLSLLQRIFPTPGNELASPALQADSLPAEPEGKPSNDKGFPDSSVGKESTYNAGDPGSIPGLGRSPGEGIGYPLQYSWASLVAKLVKNLPAMWETWV